MPKDGFRWNDVGVALEGQRRFVEARDAYERATQLGSDQLYKSNLARVEEEIQTAQALSRLADSVTRVYHAAPSALDFKTVEIRTGPRKGAGTFGAASSPSNPGVEGPAGVQSVAVHSAVDQASSAANSGAAANAKSVTDERAKELSNCAFDTDPCARFTSVSVHRVVGKSPATSALAAHIPEGRARDDTEIRQSITNYQRLEGQGIDAQTKLYKIQQQIRSHAGDAAALSAQETTLANDLKRVDADKAKVEKEIKQRLVTIQVLWVESPPASRPAGSQ
jgi:hypothetical protein